MRVKRVSLLDPEEVARGVGGLLQGARGRGEEVGVVAEHSQGDEPARGVLDQGRHVVEPGLEGEPVAVAPSRAPRAALSARRASSGATDQRRVDATEEGSRPPRRRVGGPARGGTRRAGAGPGRGAWRPPGSTTCHGRVVDQALSIGGGARPSGALSPPGTPGPPESDARRRRSGASASARASRSRRLMIVSIMSSGEGSVAVSARPALPTTGEDLGERAEHGVARLQVLRRLGHRHARHAGRHVEDAPLVQVGHELAAQAGRGEVARRPGCRRRASRPASAGPSATRASA